MSVHGALSTMPAEDVLEWVVRRRLSAPITFERGETVRSLVVDCGVLVWASSNRRDEQLGVILARSGLIGERELADALEARAETGVPLGKVLLMSGLISELDLIGILASKIREAVTDVVSWTDGSFDLVPRTQPPAIGVNAQLAVDVCLTVARRRLVRLAEIMNVLGSDDATFYVPPNTIPPATEPDQAIDDARAWQLARERHSAADIAAAFEGERFDAFDALARMVRAGTLVVDRRNRERTNSAVELAAGARGRLLRGDRAGGLAMARQALHQDPSDAEVRKTYAKAERARVAEVAKRLLSRHGVPRLPCDRKAATSIAELGLTDVELEIAARVDGRWDLLSLVRSAGVREAEALLAFARLAELGVIELG